MIAKMILYFLNTKFGGISHRHLSSSDIDLMISDEIFERLIHEDHIILLAELEYRVEMLCFTTDDEVAYGVIIEHDLSRYDESCRITLR